MAEYFMFDHWRLAVSALMHGNDVYGTNYQEVEGDHFRLIGGNFWWANSDYVKTLPTLNVNHEYRTETETWILSETHNVYCPYEFTGSTHYDEVPEVLYLPDIPWQKKMLPMLKSYFGRYVYIFRQLFKQTKNMHNPLLKKGC